MEVIVAQLPEWLLPTPDDQGLNPIMNIYWPTLNFKEDGNKEKGREWIVYLKSTPKIRSLSLSLALPLPVEP